MNIAPRPATSADLAYPDGAIIYHLSEDQYRALRAGGMGRELIEIELVALAGAHLRDSIWIVGPHELRHSARPSALAVVHEDGQILYQEEREQTKAPPSNIGSSSETRDEMIARVTAIMSQDPEYIESHRMPPPVEQAAAEVAAVTEIVEAIDEATAKQRPLTAEQWDDFLLILDVALSAGILSQESAAAHRATKPEAIKEELRRISTMIRPSEASEIERHARAAAADLLRELES